ncbi:hypothetical protein TWF102_003771 [Orbilia oligospora]|uniref:Uncharacterized protein n=1 Tax=Orbilia oligospora TaxID=2813651 RepID=A0A7C8IYP1_ORBOL|nr:hypothetical protein TWF102_003771 [Orbilia oligospora]KAF3081210.1 hypothetical protein TWF103_003908 [Orbilia oligospora]
MPQRQMHTEERARLRRQRIEQRNQQLDEAIAAACAVTDSKPLAATTGKSNGKLKMPRFTVIEPESDAEPESSMMALQRPRAVPKSKLLFEDETEDEQEEMEVERQSEESESMEIDDEVAVEAPAVDGPRRSTRVKQQKNYNYESESDEDEGEKPQKKKRVRRLMRSEKVPLEILKDCIEEEERFHLSLSSEHNLNSPDGSPAAPPDATKYDVGWLIDAIRGAKPIGREYSEENETRRKVSNPFDMAEEMEMIAAKEEQLEADLETMNEIRFRQRKSRPSLTLSVTVGKRIYCIEKNLDMLRDFRVERERYWKRKQKAEETMKQEEELQEGLKILHAFNADRENNKLRPKASQKKPLDSPSPSPPAQGVLRKRSLTPDGKPKKAKRISPGPKPETRCTPPNKNTKAKEPKSTPRLILVCRIAEAKQRELDETMAQAYRLQEELLKLTAEVEKISIEELGFEEEEEESPTKVRKLSKSPSFAVKGRSSQSPPITIVSSPSPPITIHSTPSPAVNVNSTSTSFLVESTSPLPVIQDTSSSATDSGAANSEDEYLSKRSSIRGYHVSGKLMTGARRTVLTPTLSKGMEKLAGKKEKVQKGHPAKKTKLKVEKKKAEDSEPARAVKKLASVLPANQKRARAPEEPRVVTKPTSILPAKRKKNRELEEPTGKTAGGAGPQAKKTKLQKERSERIDDLQTFFKMGEYKSGKGTAASKK